MCMSLDVFSEELFMEIIDSSLNEDISFLDLISVFLHLDYPSPSRSPQAPTSRLSSNPYPHAPNQFPGGYMCVCVCHEL